MTGPGDAASAGLMIVVSMVIVAAAGYGIGAPLAKALRAAARAALEVEPLTERIWRRAKDAAMPKGSGS